MYINAFLTQNLLSNCRTEKTVLSQSFYSCEDPELLLLLTAFAS